ncbi:MAG: hypothetical protein ACLS61_10035, partial [Ruminococcus sp.]
MEWENVPITRTRSHCKPIRIQAGFYRRYVDQPVFFEYIKYKCDGTAKKKLIPVRSDRQFPKL